MKLGKLLVANRGEIAVRIIRAASELGIETCSIYSEADINSIHWRRADEAFLLQGSGAQPYLDIEQIVEVATDAGCAAVHPGYGFLSENPEFAIKCESAGIKFVGPESSSLNVFGDKVLARQVAMQHGVPVVPGLDHPVTVTEAMEFLGSLEEGQSAVLKAVHGGGGRGVRVLEKDGDVEQAYRGAQTEAESSFGSADLYIERYLPNVRHIEVQIAGDATGAISHFWERDCSVQRRHQKIIEIAPAPFLDGTVRDALLKAAVTIGEAGNYENLGTVEFLVSANQTESSEFFFIEINPRLQVEHTVTEEVTGIDLVQTQLRIASGESLASLGLLQGSIAPAQGYAIQARVNMEKINEDATVVPSAGTLSVFAPPSGLGVRTDTFGYSGYQTATSFDSLLAKVIGYSNSTNFASAIARVENALAEFDVKGVDTNIPFLRAILGHASFRNGEMHTRFVDSEAAELSQLAKGIGDNALLGVVEPNEQAGATIDSNNPLAVLDYGVQASRSAETQSSPELGGQSDAPGSVKSPLQGTVVSIEVSVGEEVQAGQLLVVMESMKMQHEIKAHLSGSVTVISVGSGDTLWENHTLMIIEAHEVSGSVIEGDNTVDLDYIRPDLEEILVRRAATLDENREEAVSKRHSRSLRTVQENVEDLFDTATFLEYGPLVLANQFSRRSLNELIEKTPRDGMITGIGSVNGDLFSDPECMVATIAYDYMVLAGTQGNRNHQKTDRLIEVARNSRLPLVLFAEGGGGRPGDDGLHAAGGSSTFASFSTLSGLVPMVGITAGRCFAGNASLLACCDVIIATEGSNIGMGGPAMIEGGGLGIFAPEDIGPMEIQIPNGVVDISVKDEAEAVQVTKKYLSYFQGPVDTWEAPNQREMRQIVPENRLRVYNVRDVVNTLADVDSVLEIRPEFGIGMVTALVRVEGRSVGVIANNPGHLGGAIDSDGADKAARFMQLCDAFDLPLLTLVDTPGIMVGPEVEKTALVRHANRLFLHGANIETTFMSIILRKAYGLGAIAMTGGNYRQPQFTVSWPTGEFGGMGLEGSVKLGYRDELASIADPGERLEKYEAMVARAYERGKALNTGMNFGFDDTIDPAESRAWIAGTLKAAKLPPIRSGKKRPFIDAW